MATVEVTRLYLMEEKGWRTIKSLVWYLDEGQFFRGRKNVFLKAKAKTNKSTDLSSGFLIFDYEGTRNILMHTFLGISGL